MQVLCEVLIFLLEVPASTSFALSVPWVAYWLFYKGELICKYCSPRAQGFLFTFSRPKGLKVVSSVEISADFENPFLKKICVERFSEIELKVGYPHFELWPFCKSEN